MTGSTSPSSENSRRGKRDTLSDTGAAATGLGVGFAQQGLVLETPGMVTLLPDLRPPPLEIWLTTHRELFTSRRIRVIYDRLGAALTAYLGRTAAAAAESAT